MPTKMRQSEAAFLPRWVTPNLVNSLKREHAPNLVDALAKKNETMREGHPGTPPPPGKPGGQSDGPPHTKEKKPDCYEKYNARIVELWNQKEAMGDDLLWGLYWLDALKDLTLC